MVPASPHYRGGPEYCSSTVHPHGRKTKVQRSRTLRWIGIAPPYLPHTGNKSSHSALSSMRCKKVRTRCRVAPHKSLLQRCSSPFMRLAEHLNALRAWCKQSMSAWSVKTRRALSRYCRDARVYGHTTTVMYDKMSIPLSLNGP